MSIESDVVLPVTPAYIELFQLDLSSIPALAGLIYYFTPSSYASLVWGGQTYLPWAIKLEGVSTSSDGAPARPLLTFGNLDANKLIGTLVFTNSDIIGAKVKYIRTFESYLNTSLSLPQITYTVGRKTIHNAGVVQFELRSPLDKERGYLPNRQILKKDFPGTGLSKGIR